MPNRASVLPFCLLLLALAGCWNRTADVPVVAAAPPPVAPIDTPNELETVRAELARLRVENEQLRATPAGLVLQIDRALQEGSMERAAAALKQLAERFPASAEAGEAGKRVQAFVAKRRAQDEEAKRVAALGFKGLRVTPVFAPGDLGISLGDTAIARRWTFDSYGDGWRFTDAEKGNRFLITRMMINSKAKEPLLPGLAAYAADGDKLVRLGTLRYRFTRWQDYGTFLGTRADFRNEFSHSSRIPFTAAVSATEQDLKRRPLFIVATREGCHKRFYERFGQPPHFYLPEGPCASLKQTLALGDFQDGALAILKRVD
jgi:hypothetical protein